MRPEQGRLCSAAKRFIAYLQGIAYLGAKFGLIGIAVLSIAALSKTADLTVEATAKILTPKERVEKLIEISNENHSSLLGVRKPEPVNYFKAPEDIFKCKVSGIIKTADDSPLPEDIQIHYITSAKERDDYPSTPSIPGRIEMNPDGSFIKEKLPVLDIHYLAAYAEGYAPTILTTSSTNALHHVELVLDKGYTGKLLIQDEENRPLTNIPVNFQRGITTVASFLYLGEATNCMTDNQGSVILKNVNTNLIRLTTMPSGYQVVENHEISFIKDEPHSIQLKKGHVIPGKVVDQQTGEPIKDAHIILTYRSIDNHGLNLTL